MRSLVPRTLSGLIAAGAGLSVAAPPAAAADTTKFRLAAGSAVANGTYEYRTSLQQVEPPFRITGTLIGRDRFRCAVVQVARSGPADGLEWRTFGRHCGPGATRFRVEASYLFRGVKPSVRLCAGRNPAQAEQGRQCDVYQPPAER
ncbi:hypothetical protein [Paractinoplanes maris]|uniref:hypothetical protein n=1 Tax=Paractinoplanes maris TaxID=1734446 RepID=UPI0020207104|nr:hypothetical protein [Actinoplanes maris]